MVGTPRKNITSLHRNSLMLERRTFRPSACLQTTEQTDLTSVKQNHICSLGQRSENLQQNAACCFLSPINLTGNLYTLGSGSTLLQVDTGLPHKQNQNSSDVSAQNTVSSARCCPHRTAGTDPDNSTVKHVDQNHHCDQQWEFIRGGNHRSRRTIYRSTSAEPRS